MKNKLAFELAILSAAALVRQDRLPEVLLAAARSSLNEDGKLYDLWCDGQGKECECELMCSEAAQLCCIRRFLEKEFSEDE